MTPGPTAPQQKVSPNYAPLEPLDQQQVQQPFVQKRLLDFVLPLRNEMRKEAESEEWGQRIMKSQKNEWYFRGYQKGRKADLGWDWRPIDPKPIHYTLNEFQFWINVGVAKAIASRIEFRFKGLSDLEDEQMAANKLRVITEHFDGVQWTRTETVRAWKGLMFTGYMVAHVYYDPDAEAGKAYRPVTDRRPVKLGNDVYRCAACGHVGEIEENEASETEQQSGQEIEPATSGLVGAGGLRPGQNLPDQSGAMAVRPGGYAQPASNVSLSQPGAGGFEAGPGTDRMGDIEQLGAMPAGDQGPTCEECGSDLLDITKIPSFQMDVVTGQEEYNPGDVCCDLISIYSIVWNAKLGLEKSPLVLWEEDHDVDDLKATYQGLEIPETKNRTPNLDAKANLEHMNRSDNRDGKRTTLSRLWIEPRRYYNWELSEQVKTYAGVIFEEGMHPIDTFPDGMHMIMMGDLIVDMYGAVKNDDLVCMEYEGNASGGLANGCEAMCEPQRQTNTVTSLINLWIRHHAAPPKLYNPELIDAGDMSGDPTKPIPINTAMLGMTPEHTIEKAWVAEQPTQMPQGVFQYKQELRNAIQFAALATEFSEGLPSVDNQTLGGARIAQSLAQSVSGTKLSQFADFRVEIAKRKLRLFKRHCWDDKYVEFAGKYGEIEGQTISAMDIPDDFEIEAVPNSWLPRTAEQRQQNVQALLTVAGGIEGLLMAPPAVVSELFQIYDVKFGEDIFPVAVRTARWRIKQMRDLLPDVITANEMMAQAGIITNMQMAATPGPIAPPRQPPGMDAGAQQMMLQPVSVGQQLFSALKPAFNPRESGHKEAAEYLSMWFTTDEGLNSPPELIEAVGVLQDAHLDGIAMRAMVETGLAMAGQPPMPAGPPDQGPPQKGNGSNEGKRMPGPKPPMGAIAAGG